MGDRPRLLSVLVGGALLFAWAPGFAQTASSTRASQNYYGVLVPRPRGNGSSPGIKWASTPTRLQVKEVMPLTASSAGRTQWSCAIQSDGYLTDCHLAGERPQGKRFGESARKLLPFFQLSNRTVGEASLNKARVSFEIDLFNDMLTLGKIPTPDLDTSSV